MSLERSFVEMAKCLRKLHYGLRAAQFAAETSASDQTIFPQQGADGDTLFSLPWN
jgi:hypothetical protein